MGKIGKNGISHMMSVSRGEGGENEYCWSYGTVEIELRAESFGRIFPRIKSSCSTGCGFIMMTQLRW